MSVLHSESMSIINFFGSSELVHRAKLQKLLCPTIDYPWEMKEENKICLKWILELVYFCSFVSEDNIEFENQFELNKGS